MNAEMQIAESWELTLKKNSLTSGKKMMTFIKL